MLTKMRSKINPYIHLCGPEWNASMYLPSLFNVCFMIIHLHNPRQAFIKTNKFQSTLGATIIFLLCCEIIRNGIR